jgi:hypothetical protein
MNGWTAKEERMPPITGYALLHMVKGTTTINLELNDGTATSLLGLSLEEASFILDLLRNEKPVNFIAPNKIGFGTFEPVGEGE